MPQSFTAGLLPCRRLRRIRLLNQQAVGDTHHDLVNARDFSGRGCGIYYMDEADPGTARRTKSLQKQY